MGRCFDAIDPDLARFLAVQHVFFVATAPLAADGHVNLSPKGYDTFRVLGPREVAYLDLTGSGVETIAHLRENGRIVLMFCAFEGPPRIVRLWGRGEALEPGHPDFAALQARFPALGGVRAVVRVAVDRIADSCGFGVPRYKYEGPRTTLTDYWAKKGEAEVCAYQRKANQRSLDRLPGLP